MIGIYAIYRTIDNKCMYVGQSMNVENRIRQHLRGHMHKMFNKEEYFGKILEEHLNDDKTYRLQRETYWINKLNPELNHITDGSCWNKGLTKEQDRRLKGGTPKGTSSWCKGLTKETDARVKSISEKLTGRSQSEETKEKNRQSHLGKKHSEETILKFKKRVPWNKGLTKEQDNRLKGGAPKGRIPWNKKQ